MKTKKRLSLILISSAVIFFIAAFVLEKVVSKKVQKLQEERLANDSENINQLLKLHTIPLQNYVEENSYWNEFCSAINKKDTNWIIANVVTGLSKPTIEAKEFFIINTDGKIFFEKQTQKTLSSTIEEIGGKLIKTAGTGPSEKVCFKTKENKYFEGFIASIVPRADFKRKTKPYGYLLIGEVLKEQHFAELKNLNKDFEYTIVTNPNKETLKDYIDEGTFVHYKQIPSLNGDPLTLKVTSFYPETNAYLDFVRIALCVFLLFTALIIFILYRYFFTYFFHPLQKITTALEEENATALADVKSKNTELGRVAKLIELYFKQNNEYQAEINNRVETEAELKWAVEQIENATIAKVRAEQSAVAKSEFLATMSHEIRTPINGVIGIANLLKDEELTPRQKEYVDILAYSSKHLLALVSDILDFSKIETGKVEFETSSFNLEGLCESIYQVFKISADNKNIELKYIPDKAIEHSVYGDSMRVNQVLTNLVGNAIKFTQEGSVTISYKLISRTTNNCTVEFIIADTGIGIANAEQNKIFDGFSQANKKIASNFGGTGLGLSISKKLIELQGGKLTMKSKIGVGSEFSFYLTFETHAYENVLPNANVTGSLKRETLDGMKILVAEDNSINILVLKRFLEKWNVQYQIATNGKAALDLIEKEDFDLVLMDIHMPEMDGEEATSFIRLNTNKKISKIPIIALTANASSDVQQKLLNSGFTNYISKPFNPDNLFRLLKKYYFQVQ